MIGISPTFSSDLKKTKQDKQQKESQKVLVYERVLIKPIPMLRRSLPNSSHLRGKIKVHAYKNFSKIAASGRETLLILENLLKVRNLKHVGAFEFDPFLCKSSNIQQLSKCLRKLKGIKSCSLSIRRLDFVNESSKLYYPICRLIRMKRLRIEFPCTEKIDEQGIIKLFRAIGHCHSLKVLEYATVNLSAATAKTSQAIEDAVDRLIRLEELKNYMSMMKNKTMENTYYKSKSLRTCKLKKMDITWNGSSEWVSMSSEGVSYMKHLQEYFQKFANLTEFTFRNTKYFISSEDLVEYMQFFGGLPVLKVFTFKFLNSKITDRELGALAFGISRLKSLNNLTISIMQGHLYLTDNCVFNFVNIIVKLQSITEFRIYFRKLELPESATIQLVKSIKDLDPTIKCGYARGALDIHKQKLLE